jgi:HEAT repeat protein
MARVLPPEGGRFFRGLVGLVLAEAIAIGVVACICVFRPPPGRDGNTARLLRYTRNIRYGQKLRDEDIEVVAVAERGMTRVTNIVDETRLPYVIGHAVYRHVQRGRFVYWRNLVTPDANTVVAMAVADAAPGEQVAVLIRLLRSGDRDVCDAASDALAKCGNEAVLKLVEALGAPDRQTRIRVGFALHRFGSAAEPAMPALVDALRWAMAGPDDNDQVNLERMSMAWALGAIGEPAIPALVDMLRGASDPSALALLPAFQEAGPVGISALIGALKADSPTLRDRAAMLLGQCGQDLDDKTARMVADALTDGLTTDGDPATRCRIAMSLGLIGRVSARGTTVRRLREQLRTAPDIVKVYAAFALVRLDPNGREGLPELLRMVRHPDKGVRKAAISTLVLAGSGAKKAVPDLIEALKEDDADLRAAAAIVLHCLGPDAAAVVGPLIGALEDTDSRVRMWAAMALGAIGPAARTAEGALIRADQDPEPTVRRAAREARRKIRPDADRQAERTGRLSDVFRRFKTDVLVAPLPRPGTTKAPSSAPAPVAGAKPK